MIFFFGFPLGKSEYPVGCLRRNIFCSKWEKNIFKEAGESNKFILIFKANQRILII